MLCNGGYNCDFVIHFREYSDLHSIVLIYLKMAYQASEQLSNIVQQLAVSSHMCLEICRLISSQPFVFNVLCTIISSDQALGWTRGIP